MAGFDPLRGLVEEIAAGQVDTLVITAENPVYAAPSDFKLAKLLERVPNVIYLGDCEDETGVLAGTYIPKAHVLEAWGDGAGPGRHRVHRAAADPPAVGRPDRVRAAGGVRGRGREGRAHGC